MLRRHRESKTQLPSLFSTLPLSKHRMISYQELCQGTNNFCESNLLGAGGFGSVYKGLLLDGTVVAIKVLNLQLAGAFKSFDVECKVLRTIRHRNLVKVISTCSNPEFRALVLQYMSNGSLERWLYSYNYCLNLLQRVNIMIDVASALDYLHSCLSKSVVHCDLKPTNILLDEDMVAHVGDFGIAKILAEDNDATQTKTLGTLGYIAPGT
jgi:LRR receptor-like serine/threonine-protein kinase FLS2